MPTCRGCAIVPLLTTHELACLACLASPASPARLALDRRDCHRCPYDPWNAQTWKAKDMAASERLAIEACRSEEHTSELQSR